MFVSWSLPLPAAGAGSVFREGGSRAAKDDLIELLMMTKEERNARARFLATGEPVPVNVVAVMPEISPPLLSF